MPDKLSFCPAFFEDIPMLLRWSLDHAKAYETARLDWRQVEKMLDEKLRLELPDCRAVFRNGQKVGYFSLHRRPDYLELDNFQVETAADGITGLEQGLHGTFGLILLDLMLPGMDGFNLCRRLREESDIPILMVTARREDIDKIRGLGLGADDYIEKPFSPSVLVARVRAHLARYERLTGGQKKANPELRAGNLRLNTVTRRVFVNDQEVELKNREYELLQFLMLHPDMVLSREELYEKIWGLDAMGDNATVAVHINRVREKIEPDPSHPRYIQTVWGAGYRFKGQ